MCPKGISLQESLPNDAATGVYKANCNHSHKPSDIRGIQSQICSNA